MAQPTQSLGFGGMTNYGGQQVLTDPGYMSRLQTGLDSYNQSTGGGMSLQDYDKMLNPSTYGARWGVPDPQPQVAAQTQPAGTAAPDGGGYTSQNPYLGNMADEMGRRTNLSLQDAFNQIRSNSVGVGGLGGDRQGIAEGVATRGAMDSLQGNLSNLYGGQYNADANRDLSRYQGDQSFYSAQRGQDLTQTALGAQLYGQGFQGQWSPITNANSVYGNYTGFGNTTGTNQQGGGAVGALGGALGGAQLANNMNYGGTPNGNNGSNNGTGNGGINLGFFNTNGLNR